MNGARTLRWWLIVAILACAGLYLVGNGQVPLWDRDEGWYAQCSKQMWETGDWVVPRFLDKLRPEKPALVYWLQLGGYALFGGPSEFAVRFYAAVAQTLVLCILAATIWRMAGPKRAVWTAFIYGTCILAIITAKMCLTDATMMVFLVTAQMCLMAFYLGYFSWRAVMILFVALGLGVLTKGPVALIPTIMTVVMLGVLDWPKWTPQICPGRLEFWNRLSLLLLVLLGGFAIIASVSAPWLIMLYRREPEWLPGVLSIAHQHITTTLDGHTGPFGYYLALVWATFFPWSLLLPVAVYIAWKQRHVPQTRFAIAAIVGPLLFFELMKTKLPHYPLPTYPFLALLVADAIVRCSRRQYLTLHKPAFIIAMSLVAVPTGLVASAPWLATLAQKDLGPLPYLPMRVVSIMGLLCTVGTWWFFHRRKPVIACGWLGGSFIALFAVVFGWLVPQCTYLHTSSRIAEVLAQCDGLADQGLPGDVAIILYGAPGKTYGYQEPSLAFYQGGSIRNIEVDRYLEITPAEKWPRVMVLNDQVWDRLEPQTRDHLNVVGTVRGLLYSDEHRIADVIIATRK